MGSISALWIPTTAASVVLFFVILFYAWEHLFGFLTRIFRPHEAKSALEGDYDDEDLPPLRKSKKRKKKRAKKLKEAVAIDLDRTALHPVELSWEDVSCTVPTGDAKGIKVVLQKSKGTFLPSEFVAIVGPSGAGKSSMLDVLAGRKTGKGVEGLITLNGHHMTRELANRCISYVSQEDVFMPNLSVWESLMFVSQLCMDPLPRAQLTVMMDTVLDQMGLLKVKKSKVGGTMPGGLEVRGLSGGEKRRLSIACGLMGNPSILFLDEPTTGLDSHAALAVMTYLSTLAAKGHTIVSTIHQPRQEIFSAFDKVLVLSEGYQLYLAPPSYVTRWFVEVLGYSYNKTRDGTESDWLLSTVAIGFEKSKEERMRSMTTLDEVKAAAERFENFVGHMRGTSDAASSYAASELSGTDYQDGYSHTTSRHSTRDSYLPRMFSGHSLFSGTSHASKAFVNGSHVEPMAESVVDGESGEVELAQEMGSLYARSWFVQVAVLWKRSFLYHLRNPIVAANRLMFGIIGGIIVGLCFIRIPDDSSSAQQRLSLIFWATMLFCMIPFAWVAFPIAEKRFFTLDSAKDLYSPSAYLAAFILSNVPLLILNTFTTTWIVYGLAGLRPEAWAMFQGGALLSLHSIIAFQFVTACVWYFDGQDIAASMAGLYISFSLLVCGYYIRISDMTLSFSRGISWASFNKYTFQSLAITELGYNRVWESNTCSTQTEPGFVPTQPLCTINSEALLEYYDYKLSMGQCVGAMLGFWGLFCLATYWALLRLYAKR